jgi:hypothetical protein
VQQFDAWLRQLVLLGFNSGKFDLNLVRSVLVPYMLEHMGVRYVIKKMSSYMAICTDKLLILDITNYLAAGTSLSQFLSSFETAEAKGMFPYEWLTSLEKLEQTYLPSAEEFASTLKGTIGITDEDRPYLLGVWAKNGFATMKNYLIW